MAFNNVVCRSCADACLEGAIRFQPRIMASALPLVDVEKCTGCGDCVAACPASAIKLV
ncbi:MAG: 4Fe-4S dicluster domain-containing protein [Candidatus Nitricoxidivorans perseverans]|uniref:4Fe-4S dicluster domain-containing protein n=1 Tax=Candidatus Nitricoxidivorans perseverans TaxID=2975601 RepID=A0AA49FJ35_9PROT|nr:MAG: 4Fe-4S dicluster domain-containing protein [Candidatus Nitricoxidivorans perseverans]